MAERMRSELPQLNADGLSKARQDYGRVLDWTLMGAGVHLRVDRPLRARLMAVADEVIVGYRAPVLTVFERQWRIARRPDMGRPDRWRPIRRMQAKTLICEASPRTNRGANHGTERSVGCAPPVQRGGRQIPARGDTRCESPDPYLGLGRIYLEPRGLNDVDRGVAAIQEAERRGHVIGWRQRADIGHAYRVRADGYRREGERDLTVDAAEGHQRRLGARAGRLRALRGVPQPDCRSCAG